MPLRRRSTDVRALSFEVVDDLDETGPVPGDAGERTAPRAGPTGAHGTADPVPRSGRRRTSRTAWAVVAGVAVLAAGGLVIGETVEDRRATARLVTTPGGVLPFTGTPTELWSVDTGDQPWVVWRDLLLVGSTEDAGATLVAVDATTGQETWQAEIGEGATCGRAFEWRSSDQEDEPLVCLYGPPEAVAVAAVDETGDVTGRRDLGATGAGSVYAVGPGGTVVHVRRDGPAGPPVGPRDLDEGSSTPVVVDVPGGRNVVVSLTDAVSGEVRWEHELWFVPPAEIYGCRTSTNDTSELAIDDVGAWTLGQIVTVRGCGIDATFSASGARLDDPDAPDDSVEALTGQLVNRFDPATGRSTVLDLGGAERWEVDGNLLLPMASDGTAPDLLLARTTGGLSAFDLDGTELWDVPQTSDTVLVQTGAVVLADDGTGGLEALDPTSGRALWSVDGSDAAYPFGAATDGSRAILFSGTTTDGTTRSTGYDLATGEVLWTEEQPTGTGWFAHRGALLEVTERSVARWG